MPPELLDTNVLVHAAYWHSPLNAVAEELLSRGVRKKGRYCIASQNLIEFASVATRPRLVSPALSLDEVWRFVRRLRRSRNLLMIHPKRTVAFRALREGIALGIKGPIWYDFHI